MPRKTVNLSRPPPTLLFRNRFQHPPFSYPFRKAIMQRHPTACSSQSAQLGNKFE